MTELSISFTEPGDRETAEDRCSECGGNLIQIRINKDYDILLCNNFDCARYRQPAGSVKRWEDKNE